MRKINGILKSLMAGYIVTVILLLILSFAAYKLGMGKMYIYIGICIIYAAANVVSGYIMAGICGTKRVIWGSVAGLVYFMILFICSLIFNSGSTGDAGEILTAAVICIFAGAAGGFFKA